MTFRKEHRELTDIERSLVREIKGDADALLGAIENAEITLMGRPCPGRELAIAKTKLEEAVMWAVKGITA